MPRSPTSPLPDAAPRPTLVAGVLLVLAGFAAYANSLGTPFVFDVVPSLSGHPSIHHLATAFRLPGGGLAVAGRPVLTLSFVLNHGIGGTQVWSYHLLNLLIHLGAGLVLFGLVRRTLEVAGGGAPAGRRPDDASPRAIGLAVALLWVVHPLQTEAVTCVAQRAESLAGLFYLLTLYCFLRGASPDPGKDTGKSVRWFSLAAAFCLLGMGTDDVMVSAPIMVLLYDRTYLAGGFREAWRRRRNWHLALAATWVPLAALMIEASARSRIPGSGAGVLQYVSTQFEAVTHYLVLVVWPHPLVIDYGARWVTSIPDVVPYAAVTAVAAALTAMALWQRPRLGYLGAWFFAILAPTSLVPQARQTIAEHRMYLALAPALVLLVLGLHALVGRRGRNALVALAAGLAVLTVQRNHDYRSRLALWTQTVLHRPDNPAPRVALGHALFAHNQPAKALAQFEAAVRLDPTNVDAYYGAGNALVRLGRLQDAIGHFQASVQLRPDAAMAHRLLAGALMRAGQTAEAVEEYGSVVWLLPQSPAARFELGAALRKTGRIPEAVRQFQAALRLQPDFAPARRALAELSGPGAGGR